MSASRPGPWARWPAIADVSSVAARLGVAQPPFAVRVSSTREVLIGGILAVALIAAVGLDSEALVAGIALVVCLAAILSPAIGLAVLTATVSLHEPDAFRPLSVPVVLVASLVLGVVIRVVVDRRRGGLNLMVLLGLGYLALSAVTLLPMVTGLDREQTANALYELLQIGSILATVAVAQTILHGRDVRPFIWLGLASVAFTCGLAVVLASFPSFEAAPFRGLFSTGEFTRRLVGPFNDPNYFGLFLAVAACLALAVARTERGLRRWLAVGIAVFAGVVLVLTFSRGAMLALGFGVIVLAWIIDRRLGMLAVAGLVVAALVIGPVILSTRLELTSGGLFAQPVRDQAESDSFRSDALSAGLRLFADSPAFGTGFGQFPVHARRYIGGNPTTNPHNAALKLLAEQGIVGVTVFAAMVLAMLARVWRATRRDPRFAVWPAMVAYAAGALFLEPLISLQTSGLLAIAVGAVLSTARAPLAATRVGRRFGRMAIPMHARLGV